MKFRIKVEELNNGEKEYTPQQLFEILVSISHPTIAVCHWVTTLWYWIYKKEIYGF